MDQPATVSRQLFACDGDDMAEELPLVTDLGERLEKQAHEPVAPLRARRGAGRRASGTPIQHAMTNGLSSSGTITTRLNMDGVGDGDPGIILSDGFRASRAGSHTSNQKTRITADGPQIL